jgi:DNA-binding IclR family transcriptional regulator
METTSTNRNDSSDDAALRVLDVLEALARTNESLGASELARRLSLPKSSTHKLLASLERRGYLTGDEARRFRLHPMFARGPHAWVGGPTATLRQVAPEPMRVLAAATGESVFLGVPRDRDTFEYLDKVVSQHEVRCDADLGQARALHASSVGLVLLAFGTAGAADEYLAGERLPAMTPNTITDRARLRRELAAVRKQGYAVTHDTNAMGASGLAVPILDPRGGVLAALNVTAPTSRFDALLEASLQDLVRAAASINAAIRDALQHESSARKR